MKIGYLSEPVKEYIEAIDLTKNKTELIRAIRKFKLVANDALERVSKEDFNFNEFMEGRLKDKKSVKEKKYGWEGCEEWAKKYGCVVMPDVLFMVTMLAERFKVPWGVGYIQGRTAGCITLDKGIATWNKEKEW